MSEYLSFEEFHTGKVACKINEIAYYRDGRENVTRDAWVYASYQDEASGLVTGCVIEVMDGEHEGEYYLQLGNMEYVSSDLHLLERTLYNDWYLPESADD